MISFPQLGSHGRLGNQLFQYAYIRNMARKLNTQFYCPSWEGDDIFDLDDGPERCPVPVKTGRSLNQYPESGYSEIFQDVADNTEITGFFQSGKYYENPAEVKRWFKFKKSLTEKVGEKYSRIDITNCVSFSLRLDDDYNATREYFPACPLNYYKKSLSILQPDGPVIVFADRPDRARDFLAGFENVSTVFVDDLDPGEQLYLMSLCKDNVITNSSFAWWGAWLNPSSAKRVVAPASWTRPGVPIPITGILCDDWIKVQSTLPVWDNFQVWRIRHPLQTLTRVAKRLRSQV